MADHQPVIDAALAQQECVLTRDGARVVVLLDGRKVRVERGASRTADPYMTEADARAAFIAAIEQALSEGFAPAHREPPRAPPPPREFAPRVEAPPLLIPVREAPPPPLPAAATSAWPIDLPFVQVQLGLFDDPHWEALRAEPPEPGVTGVEFEIFGDVADAVELIAHSGLPAWTRELSLASFEGLEDYVASVLDASAVWEHFTTLNRLELRAGVVQLPGRALPALRHLEIWAATASPELIAALAAQPWPELQSLRLWLARDGEPGLPASELEPLWVPGRFPRLRSLAIQATSANDGLQARVEACGLAAQLETLVLEDVAVRGTVPEPDGINLLSTDEFFPLRSGRNFR